VLGVVFTGLYLMTGGLLLPIAGYIAVAVASVLRTEVVFDIVRGGPTTGVVRNMACDASVTV